MKSTLLLIAAIVASARAQSIDECLNKDSISCIQKTLFKKAKDFFNKDSLEIVTGVSLVKGQNSRALTGGKDSIYEQQIEKADNVVERQNALEKFLEQEISEFVSERTLKINFIPFAKKIGATARAANELIPTEIRKIAGDLIEGRGKKKYMKHMMPMMMAKFGILAKMAYVAVALLAKKALIAAAISLAISIFMALKHQHHHHPHKHEHHDHHEHHEHHDHHNKHDDHHHYGSSLSSSWSAPGPNGWTGAGWDDGAYSAQTQAYAAYNR